MSVPMCDQSTACNPHWHIRSRQSTIKRVHSFTPDLIQHTKDCHGSTMSNVTPKHTPSQKPAPQTARSSSLRYVSAAEHQTAEKYSKTGRTKPRKHLPASDLSWKTHQDFLKIQVFEKLLWKPSEDTSQRSFGMKCHSQYDKVIRLLQYSSANR